MKILVHTFKIIKLKTKVFGDSNTSHIKFGAGSGTLDLWVSGQRVKTCHIEAPPEATAVGPYLHVVIHTAIKSINNPRLRKSNSYLLPVLENRCKEILNVYPRAKVHTSLLSPSRSQQLNRHINEFNSGILDLTYRLKTYQLLTTLYSVMFCLTRSAGRMSTVRGLIQMKFFT